MHKKFAEYTIPDVHGDSCALRTMLKRVPTGERVIFLGDIVNKGGDSLGSLRSLYNERVNYKWTYIWGNHDLLFYRAILGSFRAQVNLFTQRTGVQIIEELGEVRLARVIQRMFKPYNKPKLSTVEQFKLKRDTAILIEEVNHLFAERKELIAQLKWMRTNFRLYWLSPAKNLYIHGGIPVGSNRKPKLTLSKLENIQHSLAESLRQNRLDDPIFDFLDTPEESPIRNQFWINNVSDRQLFCTQLGVNAIIVGHTELELMELNKKMLPFIRHDFGAAKCMGDKPSVLEYSGDGKFTTHIFQSSKWKTYIRK